ncbi:unnamed protein product, partial [Allacma fusca]
MAQEPIPLSQYITPGLSGSMRVPQLEGSSMTMRKRIFVRGTLTIKIRLIAALALVKNPSSQGMWQ